MAGHRLLAGTEEIVWNGRPYRRQPDATDRHRRVYYMATTAPRSYLHRDVYESAHGTIPDGWHVHHTDHNPDNNAIWNLVALSPSEHLSLHANEPPELLQTCDGCGGSFAAHYERARWCSPCCKEKWRRQQGLTKPRPHKAPTQAVCLHCSASFSTRRPWGRFCSALCRGQARRAFIKTSQENHA